LKTPRQAVALPCCDRFQSSWLIAQNKQESRRFRKRAFRIYLHSTLGGLRTLSTISAMVLRSLPHARIRALSSSTFASSAFSSNRCFTRSPMLDLYDKITRSSAAYAKRGAVGPLYCAPAVLKDNYNTADLPTTGGSDRRANPVLPRIPPCHSRSTPRTVPNHQT
jgi:hypothetical protein